MGKNLNTGAVVGSRTSADLYSGNYVSPAIQDGLNKIFKTRELIVEFLSDGHGSLIMPILSLGVAANDKSCKGTCGVNNGCCNGYLEGLMSTSFERTGGVVSGSWDITFKYDSSYFTSGIYKVGFFFAALGAKGDQITATLKSSAPGQIVYTLQGYAGGALSDEAFFGATVNMTAFINNAYTAG
jgi:hypothetical protein